ncbi:MAG TPA: TRAP transporter small permease subunit [Burkholderiales bacterium]|nr:TRAP transporter small permease subunit [Burkholderiales bacterium]
MNLLRKAVRGTSLVLLAALTLTPLLQITLRGVFNLPMAGAEELTKYFLICLTFIAASYVSAEGGQIRMEEFQALLPPRPRWILQLGIEAGAAGFFAVLFAASLVTVSRNLNSVTPVIEMPFWLFFAPLVVGSFLLLAEALLLLAHTWRGRRPEEKHTVLT